MSTKVYFPGLNSLRFFAAFAVLITHVELIKRYLGFSSLWRIVEPSKSPGSRFPLESIQQAEEFHWLNPVFTEIGSLGVVFFFVLSGFLITYLLFTEKTETKTISIKSFYMRRIFRIWPLYYFIFILGFLVLPHLDLFFIPVQTPNLSENYWTNFFLYLFILPNLALAVSPGGVSVPNIGQSWSIGVEEQFYIIWPIIIKYFKIPIRAIFWVTTLYVGLKVAVVLWLRVDPSPALGAFSKFLAMSKIECMTIGGLGAYWYFYKRDWILRILYSKAIQLLAILGIPVLMYFTPYFLQDGIHMVFAVCFLVVILNASTNPKPILKIENRFTDYLGIVSYGIYMYHLLIVALVLNFLKHYLDWGGEMTLFQNAVIYLSCFGLTALVSSLSYEYLERPFIKMKKRFTKIRSGEEARA